MMNLNLSQQAIDYQRIAQAIQFLEEHVTDQPGLDQIASGVHLSKYHFQRLFKRWAGISPMQFLQYLTLDFTKQRLAEGQNLFDVSLDAGLSGPGRLHDLFVTFEAITPGEYKKKGEGIRIIFGFHPTPFGECLIAKTERGILHLSFVENGGKENALGQLRSEWSLSFFEENPQETGPLVEYIFSPQEQQSSQPFHLLLKGTNFQINVWRALLTIPKGSLVSYQDIATYIGQPKASRAVGSAIARNSIAFLIPCHRVITKEGKIHNYQWGATRKKAIIGREVTEICNV